MHSRTRGRGGYVQNSFTTDIDMTLLSPSRLANAFALFSQPAPSLARRPPQPLLNAPTTTSSPLDQPSPPRLNQHGKRPPLPPSTLSTLRRKPQRLRTTATFLHHQPTNRSRFSTPSPPLRQRPPSRLSPTAWLFPLPPARRPSIPSRSTSPSSNNALSTLPSGPECPIFLPRPLLTATPTSTTRR